MNASVYGLGIVGLLGLASADARAAVILSNGSFEATVPTVLGDDATATSAAPWVFQSGAVFNPINSQFPNTSNASGGQLPAPAQGTNAAFITNGGYYYQNVGAIEANHTYTLSVAFGTRLDLPFVDGFELLLRRDSPTSTTLSRGYYGTAGNQAGSLLYPTAPAAGTFQTYVLPSFTATSAADIGHDLYVVLSANTASGTKQIFADNYVLTDVPEPASLGLLGVGSLGLLARRRRGR